MHVRVWRFTPRAGDEVAFERAYGPRGDWARFFAEAAGFRGTELLVEATGGRYLAIDRWESAESYEAFRGARLVEYLELDKRLSQLTESEEFVGAFLTLL